MSTVNDGENIQHHDKAMLEQQYVSLLELRIAQLEALVKGPENKTLPAPASSSKPNGDPSTTSSGGPDTQTSLVTSGAVDSLTTVAQDDSELETKTSQAPVRIKHYFSRYNTKTTEREDIDVESTRNVDKAEGTKQTTDPATITRRVMEEENPIKVDYDEITILSPELKRLYNEVRSAPSAVEDLHSDLEVETPFRHFIWYWDRYETACIEQENDSEPRKAAREDLKLLMAWVRKTSQVESYFKARDQLSLKTGTIRWGFLWTLFAPGTKVYAKTCLDDLQMLEVRWCSTPEIGEVENNSKTLRVWCIGFDWNGSDFGTFEYTFILEKSKEKTDSDVTIDTLQCYPIQYHRKHADQQRELIRRGRKFWRMSNSAPEAFQYDYVGAILLNKQTRLGGDHARLGDDDDLASASSIDESFGSVPLRKEYNGQVIVDAYSFLHALDNASARDHEPPLGNMSVDTCEDLSDCECAACAESPVVQWQKSQSSNAVPEKRYQEFALSEDRLMLCPPRVLGYALRIKKWAQFRVLSCKEDSNEDHERKHYFTEQLQLAENYKDMLLAFVKNHQSSRQTRPVGQMDSQSVSLDVVEGKGKGLAILLHGPPGVGKTLTAETIALATGRPLLIVSASEIGTKATEADARLEKFFSIAARWGAILLVDEADVFLEERTHTSNPNRNMLVSVMLRCLEYFEGIIFLTTNRVTSIDVAVQSRMHLAIQYKRLQQTHKLAIYKNLINKIPDGMISGDRASLYKRVDDELCRRNDMNGRQIRNIVSAAIALANERASGKDPGAGDRRLRFNDLRTVHETTVDFIESLKDRNKKRGEMNEAPEPTDGY